MKNKLYRLHYGNGWNGSKSNIGQVFVLAPDRKQARQILSKKTGIKISHIGTATEVDFVDGSLPA